MKYKLAETDIYDFAGWLTTREGVMKVGASSDASQMSEAVGEYIKKFPNRFSAPPQRTEQEREACERCKQLEEQAYDLVGELRVANIKLSMRPPRPWVGLTKMELIKCGVFPWGMSYRLYEAIEAKLKEKNNG